MTYTLSGEDARYFELSNDGTLKLKDGIELDFERDNDYQVLITATNSDGESLKSTVNIAVNDIDEPIEAATYIFGRNGQLSVDSIWLKMMRIIGIHRMQPLCISQFQKKILMRRFISFLLI